MRAQPSAGCNLRLPMRRVASLMLLCAAVLVLAGCGDKESTVTSGQEGVTVDVGGLSYQVQNSRFLLCAISIPSSARVDGTISRKVFAATSQLRM